MADFITVLDESSHLGSEQAESEAPCNLGVAFSGGGFRATLFHLGVLLFLLKNRLLNATTTVVGVSGGAILAAYLGCHRDKFTNDEGGKDFLENSDRQACVAKLLAFVRMDLRNRVVRRWAIFYAYVVVLAIAIVLGAISWRLHASATPTIIFLSLSGVTALVLLLLWKMREIGPRCTRLLADQYTKKLFSTGRRTPFTLQDMHPATFVTSTSLTTGQLVAFGGNQIRVYQADEPYDHSASKAVFEGANLSGYAVGKAVCCSSAFPPAFAPVSLSKADQGRLRDGEHHRLTDGGIYDNVGIWLLNKLPAIDRVVVSDAGRPLEFVEHKTFNRPLERNLRASELPMYRVANYAILSATSDKTKKAAICRIYFNQGMNRHNTLDDDVQLQLATLRTDLDRFTDNEVFCLVKHGAATAHMHLRSSVGAASDPLKELTDDEIVGACGLTTADGHVDKFRASHQPKVSRWHTKIAWLLHLLFKCLVARDWICIFWALPLAAILVFYLYGSEAVTVTEPTYEGSFSEFLAEWEDADDKDAFIKEHTPRLVNWVGIVTNTNENSNGCFIAPVDESEEIPRAFARFRESDPIDSIALGNTVFFRGRFVGVMQSGRLSIINCVKLDKIE